MFLVRASCSGLRLRSRKAVTRVLSTKPARTEAKGEAQTKAAPNAIEVKVTEKARPLSRMKNASRGVHPFANPYARGARSSWPWHNIGHDPFWSVRRASMPLYEWDFIPRGTDVFLEDFEALENGPNNLAAAYPVNVKSNPSKVVISADLPGFSKADISVSVESGALIIEGERKFENTDAGDDASWEVCERGSSHVMRRIALPKDALIDKSSKPEASYSNGVLEVSICRTPKDSGDQHVASGDW